VLRTLILAALLLALGAGSAPARDSGGTTVAFVAVEKMSQLVAVDLTTKRIVRRIPVPKGPTTVDATGDARYLLVTSPPARSVTLVDSFTSRVVKRFAGFGRPLDVAVEGKHAFVTDARWNFLVIIDLDLRLCCARFVVPRRPQSIAVGDVALITHSPPNPYLTVVELGAPGPLRPGWRPRLAVPAVRGANDITEQPDSAYAYVTGRRSGGVAGIDWGRGGIPRWWRKVGVLVEHVAFDYFHGRRVWASDSARGEVLALSSETGRVLRRLRGCPGAGPIAFGGGAWIAATCRDANALAVWNTRTWKRTLVRVGGRPHGVAVAVVP
jgi:DNA-binding beta-propeller fold protein YncE